MDITTGVQYLVIFAPNIDTDMAAPDQKRLLIVEDNHDTRLLLRYMLRSYFDVHSCSTMDEAIEKAGEHSMDIFLLDINLRGNESGVKLLNRLREDDRYAAAPVLALTAHALPGDREEFLKMGFDGYVSKPFSRKELVQTIRDALQQAQEA